MTLRAWTAGAVWLLTIWLLTAMTAQAQHWAFQGYGPEAGLTNPNILALHQDRPGFLWVSTEGGLFRYDGDQFRAFEVRLPGKSAAVTSLHTSADGQLCAGSMAGLFRWSGDRFEAVPGFAGIELESQAISSDSSHVYLASLSGIWSIPLKGGRPPEQITSANAASVFAGNDHTVWFGCGTGLCTLRDGRVSEWKNDDGLAAGPWLSILEDSDGQLWIRSAEMVMTRQGSGGNFRQMAPLASTHLAILVGGRNGQVLVPHTGGLAICERNACRNYGVESGLQRADVLAVTEDREGPIWIGYSGRGLARWLGREGWQSFGELEGLDDSQIWRIVRDRYGTLWVGTNRGLFQGFEQDGRWTFRRSEVLSTWTCMGCWRIRMARSGWELISGA